MKDIMIQATNKLNIVGKLLNVEFGEGKMSDGRDYKRANVTVRVNQAIEGKEETSEITAGFFASPYTKTGKPNPAYKSLTDLQNLKTAQNVGIDNADKVVLAGATLSENNFVSRSGNLVNGFQIRGSFVNNTTNPSDAATFITEIYIMDMHEETDHEGEFTGRLVIRGGIVQYGGRLDVLDFVVEAPDKVEYISNNWEVNKTITVKGRIRMTSQEVAPTSSGSSWGEDIQDTTTSYVRELVITGGDDEPKDEEFGYDGAEIKKAFNERKARVEQMTIDARSKAKGQGSSVNTAQSAATKYSWE